jgi:hypothetical protein
MPEKSKSIVKKFSLGYINSWVSTKWFSYLNKRYDDERTDVSRRRMERKAIRHFNCVIGPSYWKNGTKVPVNQHDARQE